MRLYCVLLAALLAVPSVARAQEPEPEQGRARTAPLASGHRGRAMGRVGLAQGAKPQIGTAVPRAVRPPGPRVIGGLSSVAPSTLYARAQEQTSPNPERRAIRRGSRPQGDNPQTGTAIRRSAPPPRSAPPAGRITTNRGRTVAGPDRDRTVIVRRPSVYNYYYPRGYYPYAFGGFGFPYGYGAFGLGYFYYDPYRLNGYTTYGYYGGYGGYGSYYPRPFSTFDLGELRLDVSPRHAQVFVDGYYSGVVDDYDGMFQALKLESGTYRIEIVAPGYETLTFDVRISPEQKIRYQGELRRLP